MSTQLDPFFVRHREGRHLIGCGNTKYWQLVKAGEIEVVGRGAMSRATYDSIKRYVAKLVAEARERAA
jgi:hypothetical protein